MSSEPTLFSFTYYLVYLYFIYIFKFKVCLMASRWRQLKSLIEFRSCLNAIEQLDRLFPWGPRGQQLQSQQKERTGKRA